MRVTRNTRKRLTRKTRSEQLPTGACCLAAARAVGPFHGSGPFRPPQASRCARSFGGVRVYPTSLQVPRMSRDMDLLLLAPLRG